LLSQSKRRADEPASYCRRYPPNAKHPAEGAMKPLFRPASLVKKKRCPFSFIIYAAVFNLSVDTRS